MLSRRTVCCFAFLLAFCVSSVVAYEARLVGGKAIYNQFGDLTGYIVFAETGAVVTPAPQFAIYQNNALVNLYSSTVNSNLTWSTVSFPFGGSNATGTAFLNATTGSRFVMSDLSFPFHGKYNVKFVVKMHMGPTFTFNHTFIVDSQPAQISVTQFPAGYNGTALTVPAQGQLQDFVGNPARTTTPTVSFVVVSGPGVVDGTYTVNPDSGGIVKFPLVILTQPGTYVCRIVALLTNGNQIGTATFQLVIQRALPRDILIVQQASGIARAVFFTPPRYRIVDAVGFSQDSRTNITLRLGYNVPTITYQGLDTIAHLTGVVSRLQSGFDYGFDGLSIDLPGRFEIVATLYLDGDVFMEKSFTVDIADQPTFLIPDVLSVNTISVLTLIGFQPKVQPLYLKVSNDIGCVSSGSDVAPWAKESNPILQQRNLSLVPFTSGEGKYLCISIPSQSDFIPLLKNYEPAFNEPYALDYTFSIFGVSTCRDLTATEEFLYRSAGWSTATKDRSYGCKLQPPVSGTIAPCDCFFTLACVPFKDKSFTPPYLDIGACECCKGWVLAIASIGASGFMLGLLAVVYVYV